jgi:integrase
VWLGSTESVDPQKWLAYYTHLANLDCSAETKKKRLRHAQGFLAWLDENLGILAPRNLRNRKIKFRVSVKAIETMTLDEVRTLVSSAPGQLKLHLILMLNCGYSQQDISDLRRDEIDLPAGRIIRKRSKTSDEPNVPTVNYKLWKSTLALLKQYLEPEGDLALRTRSGTSWVTKEIKNGKLVRSDNIKSNYVHLMRKTKIRRPIKLLRKTSATMLETNSDHSHYVGLFLGHAPSSMAERHYVDKSQERFDLAVEWLGQQFGETITG